MYNDLLEAAKKLRSARAELDKEEGMLISPAWKMVCHAENYLLKQAKIALRGE